MNKTTPTREILEPYKLDYANLITLSSSSSPTEIQRLETITITRSVKEALGPTGPGLLTISGLPSNIVEHRNSLLPLARDLSILPPHFRTSLLKDHGLGSDVPLKNLDRCVSSFAMQLKYGHDLDSSKLSGVKHEGPDKHTPVEENVDADEYDKKINDHFKDLGYRFKELGYFMMDLGLRVARICDKAIGGKELEGSLLESGTAKGRLIHYHSSVDTCIIKACRKRNGSKKGQKTSESKSFHRAGDEERMSEKSCDLWQQWHYDYGTFTVLTSPMFIRSEGFQTEKMGDVCENFGGSECSSPSEDTYLQIFHPNKKNIFTIKAPPDSFILQVGESADILSKQKLRASLHAVSRPLELENLSRETFVVFLHPAWNRVFDISDYPMEPSTLNDECQKHEGPNDDEDLKNLTQGIHNIIPSLSSRLKNGMTFADFSRQTTKQYYGGNGLQSNR